MSEERNELAIQEVADDLIIGLTKGNDSALVKHWTRVFLDCPAWFDDLRPEQSKRLRQLLKIEVSE